MTEISDILEYYRLLNKKRTPHQQQAVFKAIAKEASIHSQIQQIHLIDNQKDNKAHKKKKKLRINMDFLHLNLNFWKYIFFKKNLLAKQLEENNFFTPIFFGFLFRTHPNTALFLKKIQDFCFLNLDHDLQHVINQYWKYWIPETYNFYIQIHHLINVFIKTNLREIYPLSSHFDFIQKIAPLFVGVYKHKHKFIQQENTLKTYLSEIEIRKFTQIYKNIKILIFDHTEFNFLLYLRDAISIKIRKPLSQKEFLALFQKLKIQTHVFNVNPEIFEKMQKRKLTLSESSTQTIQQVLYIENLLSLDKKQLMAFCKNYFNGVLVQDYFERKINYTLFYFVEAFLNCFIDFFTQEISIILTGEEEIVKTQIFNSPSISSLLSNLETATKESQIIMSSYIQSMFDSNQYIDKINDKAYNPVKKEEKLIEIISTLHNDLFTLFNLLTNFQSNISLALMENKQQNDYQSNVIQELDIDTFIKKYYEAPVLNYESNQLKDILSQSIQLLGGILVYTKHPKITAILDTKDDIFNKIRTNMIQLFLISTHSHLKSSIKQYQ